MHTVEEVSLAAERQHGIVTLEELLARGVDQRTVERWSATGRLRCEAYGVYRIGGAPASFEGRVLAALRSYGLDCWASHRTAAALWGLPGFPPDARVELVRRSRTSNQRTSARVHRSTRILDHHVTVLRQIPLTTLARTVFDLAPVLAEHRLDRTLEAALRTRSCTVPALYRVLHDLGGRGRPGTARMRAVLDARGMAYVPTESELDLVGRALLGPALGFEWQVPMSDERGYIRRVDGLHRRARLVLEWDGAAFHDGAAQRALDEDGDRRLAALGFTVLRYRWAEVTVHSDRLRSEVVAAISARA